MKYLGKMNYIYRIITPDYKRAREISTDEKITPQVGDYAVVDGGDYVIGKIRCTHDYDKNTQIYEIYLDDCTK